MSPVSPYRVFPSVRILMIFLAFCGITCINCGFAAFNFGIVCMVKSNKSQNAAGEFEWSKVEQSNLLAAYAWGALSTALVGGWLADKYGGKFVFLTCLLVNLISSAVSPWTAFQGQTWFFAARVFCGMASGAGWPCAISIAARWASVKERARFVSFSLSGALFGQLITLPISGVICEIAPGWPLIFYLCAALSGVVAIFWLLVYTDHPDQCRFISEHELQYLTEMRKVSAGTDHQQKSTIPWKYILFSTASCAIYACHICNAWMGTFMNVFVPTYGKEVLDLDMQSNGFYSALILLAQVISYWIFGIMADSFICRSRSTTFSVKVFNTICMGVPIIGLGVLTFLDRNSGIGLALFSLCLCTFFYASCVAGFVRSIVLIAPKFSGTISSVSNFWSYVGCIIMPYVTGLVTEQGTASEWHTAFYIGIGISAFGCLEFLVFGSGKEQTWAKQISTDTSAAEKAENRESPAVEIIKL